MPLRGSAASPSARGPARAPRADAGHRRRSRGQGSVRRSGEHVDRGGEQGRERRAGWECPVRSRSRSRGETRGRGGGIERPRSRSGVAGREAARAGEHVRPRLCRPGVRPFARRSPPSRTKRSRRTCLSSSTTNGGSGRRGPEYMLGASPRSQVRDDGDGGSWVVLDTSRVEHVRRGDFLSSTAAGGRGATPTNMLPERPWAVVDGTSSIQWWLPRAFLPASPLAAVGVRLRAWVRPSRTRGSTARVTFLKKEQADGHMHPLRASMAAMEPGPACIEIRPGRTCLSQPNPRPRGPLDSGEHVPRARDRPPRSYQRPPLPGPTTHPR